MKPLVIIPARGGSKGVMGKNIKILGNMPLIHYSISAAREIFRDEDIYLSTDSKEIISVVNEVGLSVPFVRPVHLSTDEASTNEVILHALEHFKSANNYLPDMVILLQPTSPFRTAKHILEALQKYNTSIDMVVSVKKTKANPYFVLFEENDNGLLEKSKIGYFERRQDCPEVWELNGAIYIINVESLYKSKIVEFGKIVKYSMDDESSIDIDTPFDWMVAEQVIKNRK